MNAPTLPSRATTDAPQQLYSPLAAVEVLRPLVEANRAEIAAGPDLPDAVAGAMIDAGLAQLWLPRSLGGPEIPPPELLETMEALGRLDASIAWCAGISAGVARLAGQISSRAMRRLLPAGTMFAASGGGAPSGTATCEDGGWRIRGRWHWMSFSRHGSIVGLVCMETGDGAPAEGPPAMRAVFLSAADVEVVANWDAIGLRASGSHDVTCDVWVPDDQTVDGARLMQERPTEPLSGLPFSTASAMGIMGIPIGIAAAAIDALVALGAEKTPYGTNAPLRMREEVQLDLVRATAQLDAARALAVQTVEAAWEDAQADRPLSLERKAAVRRACWHAGDVATSVVGAMYDAAGSSAVREDAPFAKLLRDVRTTCAHVQFQKRLLLPAGRIAVGLEPGTPMI